MESFISQHLVGLLNHNIKKSIHDLYTSANRNHHTVHNSTCTLSVQAVHKSEQAQEISVQCRIDSYKQIKSN